jgi:hypothetical protein
MRTQGNFKVVFLHLRRQPYGSTYQQSSVNGKREERDQRCRLSYWELLDPTSRPSLTALEGMRGNTWFNQWAHHTCINVTDPSQGCNICVEMWDRNPDLFGRNSQSHRSHWPPEDLTDRCECPNTLVIPTHEVAVVLGSQSASFILTALHAAWKHCTV